MNLDMAKTLVQKSSGEGVYSVYIPSLKKTVPFKHMSTGQRKTLSKVAIEYSDEIDLLKYQFVKLAIAAELCLDPSIDVNKLTDIDFIAVMTAIRKNNIMTPLEVSLKCAKCDSKFNFPVDFNSIEAKAKEYVSVTHLVEKTYETTKISVLLSEPTIIMNLSYKGFIDSLSAKKSESDMRDARVLNYPIQFMNELKLNDEVVEGYAELDFIERMKFLEEWLPTEIMFDGADSVLAKSIELFPITRENALFYTLKCPFCQDVKEDAIAFDSFFTI
jgi:hypothetical protein